jgi:hypothetical protein
MGPGEGFFLSLYRSSLLLIAMVTLYYLRKMGISHHRLSIYLDSRHALSYRAYVHIIPTQLASVN